MKKLQLSFFTLGVYLVLFTSASEINEDTYVNDIFCQIMGQSWASNKNLYIFNIDDVQNALSRCQSIMFTTYYFDRRSEINTHVSEIDKNALRPLAECGKTIYIGVGFVNNVLWSELLISEDDKKFNYHVNTLILFLKKYNISGIIMEALDVFNPESPFRTDHITAFVTLLKSKIKSLKVGLYIRGQDYGSYSNSELFDFKAANTAIDHFLFDMSMTNPCTAETRSESTNPIASNNNNLITMEQISNAVTNCDVDKCKTYAILLTSTTESEEAVEANKDQDIFGSFSQLCKDAKSGKDTSSLCFDSTLTLYNQGMFVRDYFSGIMVSVIDTDDYDCSCGCRPFVATNTIIDGWRCCSPEPCETIDKLMIR